MTWLLGAVKGVFAGIWGYVAAAGAVLIAILTIYRSGKSSGINEVVVKTKEKEVENVKTARKVEKKVSALPPDELRKRLHERWTRK